MLIARDALAAEPLLTAHEEVQLARQTEAGLLAREARLSVGGFEDATEVELLLIEELGEQARQRFIRANLRLVAKLARQGAARSQLGEGDLFQEGCLGLICAVERFDFRRGNKFSTYASFWVRAYINAAIANRFGALNVPASRAHQLRLARGVELELSQAAGRAVTVTELAAQLGRSERWTADLVAHQAPQLFDGLDLDSVNLPSGGWDDPGPSHDRPGAELLWRLPAQEREVLALRFGFADGTAHSIAECARRLGLSVSRVHRIERRALATLRSVCPEAARDYLAS